MLKKEKILRSVSTTPRRVSEIAAKAKADESYTRKVLYDAADAKQIREQIGRGNAYVYSAKA